MKKTLKKKINDLLNKHKHDDYNINESQDRRSNGEVDSDKINDLNIG